MGKNDVVNVGVMDKHPKVSPPINHKVQLNTDPKVHDSSNKVTHEEEKIALILFMVVGFTAWRMF